MQELISKCELLKALADRYGDLTSTCGCNVRTADGWRWLSIADIVSVINGCQRKEGER